jgi:hypothetical protein
MPFGLTDNRINEAKDSPIRKKNLKINGKFNNIGSKSRASPVIGRGGP